MQYVEQHQEVFKNTIDGGLGTLGITSPIWLQYLENGLGLALLIGSVVLVGMRLVLTYREFKEKDK